MFLYLFPFLMLGYTSPRYLLCSPTSRPESHSVPGLVTTCVFLFWLVCAVCRCSAGLGAPAAVPGQTGPEAAETGPCGGGPAAAAESGPSHQCFPKPALQRSARWGPLHLRSFSKLNASGLLLLITFYLHECMIKEEVQLPTFRHSSSEKFPVKSEKTLGKLSKEVIHSEVSLMLRYG